MVPPLGVPAASGEQRRQQQGRRDAEREPEPGEALAAALDETGRRLTAHLDQDPEGSALVRIVDTDSGETVALLTPVDLRTLAEQSGAVSGLLFQSRS